MPPIKLKVSVSPEHPFASLLDATRNFAKRPSFEQALKQWRSDVAAATPGKNFKRKWVLRRNFEGDRITYELANTDSRTPTLLPIILYGTRPHAIYPKAGKAFFLPYLSARGHAPFASYVFHPGTKSHPNLAHLLANEYVKEMLSPIIEQEILKA